MKNKQLEVRYYKLLEDVYADEDGCISFEGLTDKDRIFARKGTLWRTPSCAHEALAMYLNMEDPIDEPSHYRYLISKNGSKWFINAPQAKEMKSKGKYAPLFLYAPNNPDYEDFDGEWEE